MSPSRDYNQTVKAWEGQAVPALSLRTVVGGTVETEALKGRPLVLNFWATWCKACVEELPDLNRLARDVTVVGISNEPEDTLKDFMKTHSMRYIVVSADGLPAPFRRDPRLADHRLRGTRRGDPPGRGGRPGLRDPQAGGADAGTGGRAGGQGSLNTDVSQPVIRIRPGSLSGSARTRRC